MVGWGITDVPEMAHICLLGIRQTTLLLSATCLRQFTILDFESLDRNNHHCVISCFAGNPARGSV